MLALERRQSHLRAGRLLLDSREVSDHRLPAETQATPGPVFGSFSERQEEAKRQLALLLAVQQKENRLRDHRQLSDERLRAEAQVAMLRLLVPDLDDVD
jgi:hypothetical protein